MAKKKPWHGNQCVLGVLHTNILQWLSRTRWGLKSTTFSQNRYGKGKVNYVYGQSRVQQEAGGYNKQQGLNGQKQAGRSSKSQAKVKKQGRQDNNTKRLAHYCMDGMISMWLTTMAKGQVYILFIWWGVRELVCRPVWRSGKGGGNKVEGWNVLKW